MVAAALWWNEAVQEDGAEQEDGDLKVISISEVLQPWGLNMAEIQGVDLC